MKKMFEGKNILITGGTGSIGREIIKRLITYGPKVTRVLDSSENALFNLQQELGYKKEVRYFLGDIREKERLERAFEDIDIVFHTAALKHVSICEYDAFEAVKTNIIGTQNVIKAALANNVDKVVFTSSDKAVNPGNTMGTSKLMAEKLIVSANYHRGNKRTKFSTVRFGNVMGSSGSVIPLFLEQIKEEKPITITHEDMTRFMISLEESLDLMLKATELTQGGEIFIMKMPVVKVTDLAEILQETYSQGGESRPFKVIGIKPGEKLYEEIMTEEEVGRAMETEDLFIILPFKEAMENVRMDTSKYPTIGDTKIVPYRSDQVEKLSKESIKDMLIGKGIIQLSGY